MLRKTLKLILVSCAFQESCSTAASLKTNEPIATGKAAEKAALKDLSVTATLVKDSETKQWPHLKPHVGQLLLANEDTQVLLPAAPPLSAGQVYFPLLSKVYRRQDKEWIAIPWLPSLEIKIAGKAGGGTSLQIVGQDIVQEAGVLTVHAFFKEKNGGAADSHLVMNIHAEQGRIDARLTGPAAKLPWTLRIGRGLGEDHTLPHRGTQVAGLTSSLLPHALSIVGDQAFNFRQDDSFNYLEAGQGGPGFKILLARDALLKQAELVQSLAACYAPQKNCRTQTSPPGAPPVASRIWSLTAPPSKQGEALWQAAMIYTKSGSFRSLIPIREGETLDIPLGGKERLDLLFADGTGVLEKRSLNLKGSPNLTLPAMQKGWLVLNLNPSEPSFVEIRNAAQISGGNLRAWVNEDDTILLSPSTLLESRWPLTMALPAGDYHVRVYDGYQVLCDQKLTILSERRIPLECNTQVATPNYSARASISADRSSVREEQLEASDIRVVTSSEPAKGKDSPIVTIPMVAAYDSELGLSMRAFPIAPETTKAWTDYLTERPDHSTLTHFSEFIRNHEPEASLVLDCPPPGFQLAEYNWIAQTLKPDVLEVFGCQQPEVSQELLQVANRLQQKQPKAVRLAAASFSGLLYGSRVPAIYLPRFKRGARIDPQLALEDLKAGRYTLGFRTELIVPTVVNTDTHMQLVIRTSDIGRGNVVVRVYDQDGKLSEERYSIGENFENKITVAPHLKASTRWLRVELLMRENGVQDGGPLFTLATSNFFRLDGKF